MKPTKRKTFLDYARFIVKCGMIALGVVLIYAYSPQDDEMKRKKERFNDGQRLEALLCDRQLNDGLLFLDTLKTKYPNDPLFCFSEGWIHDMQDDSVKARSCFKRGICMYDSLIAVKDDYGLRLNKAFLVLIVDGRKAFDKAMADVLPFAKTRADTIGLNELRKGMAYDKNKFFEPGSNKSYMIIYQYKGESQSDGTFVEISCYKGEVTDVLFWGTAKEFGAKTETGETAYFAMPLTSIKNVDSNTIYGELNTRGFRFLNRQVFPNTYWQASEQDFLDNKNIAIKDSVTSYHITLGIDSIIVENLKNKSIGTRVFHPCKN